MHKPVNPLEEFIVKDRETAMETVKSRASEAVYVLEKLTAFLGADLHHVVLDPTYRNIWYASDNTIWEDSGWTVEKLTPDDAGAWFGMYIEVILERMDDPTIYAGSEFSAVDDLAAFDEYTQILRLQLSADPQDAVVGIKERQRLLARQATTWARTYTNMLRDLAGPDHGGKAKAAKIIGLTEVQVGRKLREDDERRRALLLLAGEHAEEETPDGQPGR